MFPYPTKNYSKPGANANTPQELDIPVEKLASSYSKHKFKSLNLPFLSTLNKIISVLRIQVDIDLAAFKSQLGFSVASEVFV